MGVRRGASHRLIALGLLAALSMPLAARSVAAQPVVDFGQGPVLMLADQVRVDEERQVVIAEGDVDITRGDRRLLADTVLYFRKEDRIEAMGRVTLIEPNGDAFFADNVQLSGDLKDGVVAQLRARLEGDARLAANEGRRINGERMEMDQAVYSPCPACDDGEGEPLWQITADKVTHHEAEQEIVYNNAFFEFYGVPVFYTPWFAHPDPTVERKTGFISPSFGSDTELGFVLETPYYFALAPNYDLTVAPIITSKEGTVLTGEYRHLLDNGRFDLSASITRGSESQSSNSDSADGQAWRGHVAGDGRFNLGGGWGWGYDLFLTSDDTYLKRYDFSNRDILENRLYADWISGRNYAAINGYGFQGLRRADDQGLIPLVLPLMELELSSNPMLWGSRFFLDTSYLALERTEGLDTRRFSVTGGWELPWIGALGDQYRLRLSLRGDQYVIDGDPATLDDSGYDQETRLIPRATLDWSWPWVGNTFGLTPVIEPIASLTLAPNDLNDETIPNEDSLDLEFDDTNLFEESRFPGLDRIEDGSRVSYGFRFGTIGDNGEIFNALFGQSYRFKEDDQFDADTGLDGHFSDYVGRVEAAPTSWLEGRYRFRLDRDKLTPVRNEVRAIIGPPRFRLDGTYLSLEDDPTVSEEEFRTREEVTSGIQLQFWDNLTLRAQTRRDLQADSTIANTYGFIYRHPCLLLIGGIEQLFTENRDAGSGTTFSLRVTFETLGELGGETSYLPGF